VGGWGETIIRYQSGQEGVLSGGDGGWRGQGHFIFDPFIFLNEYNFVPWWKSWRGVKDLLRWPSVSKRIT